LFCVMREVMAIGHVHRSLGQRPRSSCSQQLFGQRPYSSSSEAQDRDYGRWPNEMNSHDTWGDAPGCVVHGLWPRQSSLALDRPRSCGCWSPRHGRGRRDWRVPRRAIRRIGLCDSRSGRRGNAAGRDAHRVSLHRAMSISRRGRALIRVVRHRLRAVNRVRMIVRREIACARANPVAVAIARLVAARRVVMPFAPIELAAASRASEKAIEQAAAIAAMVAAAAAAAGWLRAAAWLAAATA
jgi:hypothetical protein